ncbi:MAG TPA: hypothetical protein VE085_00195 [Burkholderiales bacterium]|nr:hypothetical protein [Burkholderiales bacterium]
MAANSGNRERRGLYSEFRAVNPAHPPKRIDHCIRARDVVQWAVHVMQAAVADNSVTRTLALALRTIGSRPRLAEHLGATEALLQEWFDRRREPPTSIYLLALDLVASGPFSTEVRATPARRRRSPGGRPR